MRLRLGFDGHGSLTAMARGLGVPYSRYRPWEEGSRPAPEALREAVRRLGVTEADALAAYLLDVTGTARPPSWWDAPGPPPKAGPVLVGPDPPPRYAPPERLPRHATDAAPEAAAEPVSWARIATVAVGALDARARGDGGALALALAEIRALVCPRGAAGAPPPS